MWKIYQIGVGSNISQDHSTGPKESISNHHWPQIHMKS